MTLETLGQRLRRLRTDKELSLEDVGRQLNLSFSTVAMYERDQRTPSLENLRLLADFYRVGLDDLIGRPTKLHRKAPADAERKSHGGVDLNEIAKDLPADLAAAIAQIPEESRVVFLRAAGELTVEDWRSIIDYMRWHLDKRGQGQDDPK